MDVSTENAVENAAPAPTPTTLNAAVTTGAASLALSKTLKRCLSVPIIRNPPTAAASSGNGTGSNTCSMTTRAAAAAAAAAAHKSNSATDQLPDTPKKYQCAARSRSTSVTVTGNNARGINGPNVPHSNPSSREVSPAPVFNIFTPRTRRYSASYSPLGAAAGGAAMAAGVPGASNAPLRLTPRVSQLRQEECVDMNSREINHEREVHSALQISQSWEDLTLVAENWSCKSDEFSNPLQVALPANMSSCSSPSPTSNRAALRLPYGLSPSPTRRTFATRRSMSPIAMRPSQLGPVKRKFELDDNNCSNWNVYSPPPLKKITTESRGSSPICQSPSSVCPSPDSGTYDGRITPKLFISKLCTTNTNSSNSACLSPMSTQAIHGGGIVTNDSTGGTSTSSSSPSASSSICGGSEPMCINSTLDEGISISDVDEKSMQGATTAKRMSTDMQDESTMMDDTKSETSSIGGCSSISAESSSFGGDSGTKSANFLNRFLLDDGVSAVVSPNKNFIINKQGISGPKKFIVNHDNLPNSSVRSRSFSRNSSTENMDCSGNPNSQVAGNGKAREGVGGSSELNTQHKM